MDKKNPRLFYLLSANVKATFSIFRLTDSFGGNGAAGRLRFGLFELVCMEPPRPRGSVLGGSSSVCS